MLKHTMFIAAIVLSYPAAPGFAQDPSNDPTAKPAAVDQQFQYVNPEVERLKMYVGPWRVAERHFNEKGDVVATVKGTEEVKWILDRRAISRTYITSAETSVYKAIGTMTYDKLRKEYLGIWFDTVSTTGPTTRRAQWNRDTATMTYTATMKDASGKDKEYQVVEEFLDKRRRIATTFELVDGRVIKRLEVQYTRVIPCPSKTRYVPVG